RGVQTDVVPLNKIAVRTRLEQRHAFERISRDDIARPSGRAADGVVLRATKNLDALVGIRDRRGARTIRADTICPHEIVVSSAVGTLLEPQVLFRHRRIGPSSGPALPSPVPCQ